MPLSDAAKAEIQAAIRIIKSDKTYTEVSGIVERALARHTAPPAESDADDLEVEDAPTPTPPAPAGAPAPPKLPRPPKTVEPPVAKKKGLWWNEIETE